MINVDSIKLSNLLNLSPKYYYDDWEYEDRIYSPVRYYFDTREEVESQYKVQIDNIPINEAYIDFTNSYNFLILFNLCVKHYINIVIGCDIISEDNKIGCWYAGIEAYCDTFEEAFIKWLIDCLEGTKDEIEDHVFLNNLLRKEDFIKEIQKIKWNYN
jgi:hypothetical protein